MPTATTKKPGQATQRYLDIGEIRDDIVIMKDSSVRVVLMVASINFALKAVDEQEAIVQAYMTFLNGLEFPIQIVVQSRKMNIDPYLVSLAARQKEISNELLKTQITDYRGFIQELVEMGEIMQKRFYVVVPYDPVSNKRKNFWTRFTESVSPVVGIKLKEKQIMERREEAMKRVSMINGQLTSMGVGGVVLDTQGLIELFYECYNPDIFSTEKLGDVDKVRFEETPPVV